MSKSCETWRENQRRGVTEGKMDTAREAMIKRGFVRRVLRQVEGTQLGNISQDDGGELKESKKRTLLYAM